MEQFEIINPADETVIERYTPMGRVDVNSKIKRLYRSNIYWRGLKPHSRIKLFEAFKENLKKDRESLAKSSTMEVGKPLKESLSEVDKCINIIDFYIKNGEEMLHSLVTTSDAEHTEILHDPLGVIGAIMPFNFPYSQIVRMMIPTMLVGNSVIFKPSRQVTGSGLSLTMNVKDIFVLADNFDIVVGGSETANHVIDSPLVEGIAFTGSKETGAKIASRATKTLKKCCLELGGSDPFMVLGDADIDKAVEGAVRGRFINCGQSCTASKRFLVAKSVYKEFIEKFIQKVEKLRVGDPMDENTDIGPLVCKEALNTIEQWVHQAKMLGVTISTGGNRIGGKGFFFQPTIIEAVDPSMFIWKKETFGPVAPVVAFHDGEEVGVIEDVINTSRFGLGASIWTEDTQKGYGLGRLIQSGAITVNNVVRSDPRIPSGGIKDSGFGRELGDYGVYEFSNVKTIRLY